MDFSTTNGVATSSGLAKFSDCSQPWVQIIHDNLLVPVNEVMAGYFSCTVEDVIKERAFSVKTGLFGLMNLTCQVPSDASPEFVKKALAKTSSMMLNAVDRCATNTIAMRTVAAEPKPLAPMGEARAVDAYGADLAMTLQLNNQFRTESINQWFTSHSAAIIKPASLSNFLSYQN